MEGQIMRQEKTLNCNSKSGLTIISKGRVVKIGFDEITHMSKCSNEIILYTKETSHRIYIYLKDLMLDLPANEFFRIHKSHIISLKHMTGVKDKKIVIGEFRLPMSRHFKQQLKDGLKKILNEEYGGLIDPRHLSRQLSGGE